MTEGTDHYEQHPRQIDGGAHRSGDVREKFMELWQQGRKRYVTVWRNKWLTAEAGNLAEMSSALREAAEQLSAMQSDGVMLDNDSGTEDDYALLVTDNPDIAQKYGMIEESEFWDEDASEEPSSS